MFNDSKYTDRYFKFIADRKRIATRKEKTQLGYQKHHIIPKSLGGSNDGSNIAFLTPREHFHAHLLLYKMTIGDDRSKMAYALKRFGGKQKGKSYALAARFLSEAFTGKGNPFYGQKHTNEAKQKFSGKNHGLYGKGLYINWVEKYGVDEANIRNEKYKANLSKASMGKPATIGTTGRKAVYKDGICKRVKLEDVQSMIDDGWYFYTDEERNRLRNEAKRKRRARG